MIMRGYMKVTNGMVIVWLLYGYCVVRIGNFKGLRQTCVKFSAKIRINCRISKFSGGDNFQKKCFFSA